MLYNEDIVNYESQADYGADLHELNSVNLS